MSSVKLLVHVNTPEVVHLHKLVASIVKMWNISSIMELLQRRDEILVGSCRMLVEKGHRCSSVKLSLEAGRNGWVYWPFDCGNLQTYWENLQQGNFPKE